MRESMDAILSNEGKEVATQRKDQTLILNKALNQLLKKKQEESGETSMISKELQTTSEKKNNSANKNTVEEEKEPSSCSDLLKQESVLTEQQEKKILSDEIFNALKDTATLSKSQQQFFPSQIPHPVQPLLQKSSSSVLPSLLNENSSTLQTPPPSKRLPSHSSQFSSTQASFDFNRSNLMQSLKSKNFSLYTPLLSSQPKPPPPIYNSYYNVFNIYNNLPQAQPPHSQAHLNQLNQINQLSQAHKNAQHRMNVVGNASLMLPPTPDVGSVQNGGSMIAPVHLPPPPPPPNHNSIITLNYYPNSNIPHPPNPKQIQNTNHLLSFQPSPPSNSNGSHSQPKNKQTQQFLPICNTNFVQVKDEREERKQEDKEEDEKLNKGEGDESDMSIVEDSESKPEPMQVDSVIDLPSKEITVKSPHKQQKEELLKEVIPLTNEKTHNSQKHQKSVSKKTKKDIRKSKEEEKSKSGEAEESNGKGEEDKRKKGKKKEKEAEEWNMNTKSEEEKVKKGKEEEKGIEKMESGESGEIRKKEKMSEKTDEDFEEGEKKISKKVKLALDQNLEEIIRNKKEKQRAGKYGMSKHGLAHGSISERKGHREKTKYKEKQREEREREKERRNRERDHHHPHHHQYHHHPSYPSDHSGSHPGPDNKLRQRDEYRINSRRNYEKERYLYEEREFKTKGYYKKHSDNEDKLHSKHKEHRYVSHFNAGHGIGYKGSKSRSKSRSRSKEKESELVKKYEDSKRILFTPNTKLKKNERNSGQIENDGKEKKGDKSKNVDIGENDTPGNDKTQHNNLPKDNIHNLP